MATETAKSAEKSASARRRGAGKRATARGRKKTAARKTVAARARTGSATGSVRRAPRAGGSTRLADSLTGLLGDVTSEVAAVSALSAAIDDMARTLQGQLAEFSERIGTLSRLRAAVSGGTLAAFLDETLVPQRPAELEALAERIQNAQNAAI